MNNKRKSRPASTRGYIHDRSQRGRTVQQGIYNNSPFMHAATSIVGNLVQVQTHSGSIYEGIYRTFSPNFDVAIEYAQCVKHNQNQTTPDPSMVADVIIFQPNHIVSIAAKNVDLDFATSGNFQTDSAISARCNGSKPEERELEPWDASGSTLNGDIDLELDGNSNGWDANEMFNKNEKLYGVHSTFDQSLSGYTVQIEKKDTKDYKEAEEKAEKIAQEIENQTAYHERIDLENGDEEARYAAVERPPEQSPEAPRENPALNSSNTNNMSKGGSNNDKHVVPSKRKSMQGGKVRSTPPPNNNNGPISHNAHNSKNNNYQPMQMQQGPAQYMMGPSYTHNMHGHPTNMSQNKMNGDGNLGSSNNKSMPQRGIRQYPPQAGASNSYADNQSMGGQMSMGKQMHMSQNHSHIPNQHMPANIQDSTVQQQNHMTVHSNMVAAPNAVGNVIPPQQSQPPPQPQRQPRARDDQIHELRKFQQDFNLATTNQPQQQQQQHPPPMAQVKTPSVSPHPPQPSLTPPQQQVQQQLSPMQPPPPMQQHSQQPHHSQPPPQQQHPPPQSQPHQSQQHSHQPPQQQQIENITVASTPKQAQQVQHQPPEQQAYTSQPPPPQTQAQQTQQQPPTIIQPSNPGISSVPSSTTPPQQQQQTPPQQQQILNSSSSNSDPSPPSVEKPTVKPKHVLNPSAKPFTPRSPSTPNPSRPHTPQTPGPAMTPNVYTAAQHMSATGAGGQITYVMPPQGTYSTPPHGHAGGGRIRRAPVIGASQFQVTAATGQPLLTTNGPLPTGPFLQYQQTPSHPSAYQAQYYQHMIRMCPEPPQQHIQFLAQTPPSTTPSPGQPHQQFHPGQQPSPAGGGPPAFGAAAQPPFSVMCLTAAGPQLVPNFYQGAQTPHHGQQFQLIMQPQHPGQ